MRSKIGTQSRLAAHILALFLLIIMLVYVAPPAAIVAARSVAANLAEDAALSLSPDDRPPGGAGTEAPSFPAPAPGMEPGDVAMIFRDRVDGDFGTISEPASTPLQPSALPLRPPESAAPETVTEPDGESPVGDIRGTEEPAETVKTEDETDAVPAETVATPPAGAEGTEEPPGAPVAETPGGEGEPPAAVEPPPPHETGGADDAGGTADPAGSGDPGLSGESPEGVLPVAQPDESGALVVVPSVNGSGIQLDPLATAKLEVLGDGVYWLGPRHDLETELAAIPELATLVLLAPLPGYRVEGFEHVKTEVIPADAMDLDGEAAEHFLYLTSSGPAPVVAAALPGARGAGFFKGAYLLEVRGMPLAEVLREIAPELEEAGAAGEEIEHRLRRLGD